MNSLIKNNLTEMLPFKKAEVSEIVCFFSSFLNSFHKIPISYANLTAELICGLILIRNFALTPTTMRLDKQLVSFKKGKSIHIY